MPDIKDYTGKITSEHADKPNYVAMVESVSQCFLDTNQVAAGLPDDFDLDLANDAQLDDVGLWVGISRNIPTPLTNVYFAFDTQGLGFDQGTWKGPFDPDNGITILDNETYRSLIRAKIGANHWDGTLESSKVILDLIFNPSGQDPFFPVVASNEVFAAGDGIQNTFQLKFQGQNVYEASSLLISKSDWQGRQKLYDYPRTNLTPSSDVLVAGAGTTVLSDVSTAPDSTATADSMVETAVSSEHYVGDVTISAGSLSVGDKFTWSAFFKDSQSANRNFALRSALAVSAVVVFDPRTKTVVSSAGSSQYGIEIYPDGWCRAWMTVTVVTVATLVLRAQLYNGLVPVYLGDGVSSVLVWGRQAEPAQADGLPTSLIKTTGSAVTVTDYSVKPFNQVVLPSPLESGASLSWSGQGVAYAKGSHAFLVDNQDMTISIGLAGDPPTAIQWALLTGGYITPKPQSVDIKYFYSPSTSGPLFGFDVSNQYIAGFDQGSWGNVYS